MKKKIAQVVQWSNVAMGIADKWKKRKIIEQETVSPDAYAFETVQVEETPKRKWGRKNDNYSVSILCWLNKNKSLRHIS